MSARPVGPRPAEGVSKTTVHTLRDKRRKGEPISMVTAYDFPTARAAEEAGVDAILVGDSLAMVVLGHPNTLAVTMDEMLHHARAVARGAQRPLLVGDMPFLSYQVDATEAVRNAGHFLQAGMDAVKLEGGREYAATAAAIVRAGIPVQGHIGLMPQSLHPAREILRRYGNMSAATVLFVLQRMLDQGMRGLYLISALGPGFTAGFQFVNVN